MRRASSRVSKLLAIPFALFISSCAETLPLQPSPESLALRRTTSPNVHLLSCPTPLTLTATKTIGPAGGSIQIAGHELHIPKGAVRRPTRFSVRAPAGESVQLDINAARQSHYRFAVPARVTISYDRCPRQQDSSDIDAWYIPDDAPARPEAMGGVHDPVHRTVTFTTIHLSTFAVAY